MMVGAHVGAVEHGAAEGLQVAAQKLDAAFVGMRPCSSGQSR